MGGPVRGSWWSHPGGNAVYHLGEMLEDHPEVVIVALVLHKATLVHRRHWNDLMSAASRQDSWQLTGLSPTGRALLQEVDRRRELRLDDVPPLPLPLKRSIGDVARDLERRLLVLGRNIHSDTGQHVKVLTSWRKWAADRGLRFRLLTAAEGRRNLEAAVRTLVADRPRKRVLPWVADAYFPPGTKLRRATPKESRDTVHGPRGLQRRNRSRFVRLERVAGGLGATSTL